MQHGITAPQPPSRLDGGEKNIVSTSQFGSIEQNIVITNLDQLVLNKVSNPDEVIRDPGVSQ